MFSALIERMRAVVRHPFFARQGKASEWEAILWWERRRIAFNVIVGATGILTCFACRGAYLVIQRYSDDPAFETPPPMWWIGGAVAYGVMANVGYTAGWIVELLARRLWDDEGNRLASICFTLGLVLSIALTLAPASYALALTAFEIVFALSA